jgi:hypothetical protein
MFHRLQFMCSIWITLRTDSSEDGSWIIGKVDAMFFIRKAMNSLWFGKDKVLFLCAY